MQNFYLHCITCHVLLCIFISDASLLRNQNSENDLKMDNDLQKYYISQTSDVEEPEYFWDSFSTQNYEEANSIKYVDIFRQNLNKEDTPVRKKFIKYPLIDFIKAVDRPIEDYNTRRILNLRIRTNAKRNAEIKDEKHIKEQDFENKIKEMDLANNPDALVEVFINILKNKYPEKLLEMKNLLDRMAISGELNCSDNDFVKESVTLKEKIQASIINPDMVSSNRRITSTTNTYRNITDNSATIESESSSSVSITSTTNDREKEEEEFKEEEDYEDDNSYDNRNEDDAENYENNDYNAKKVKLREKLKYIKEEVKPISAGRKNRNKKLKSIIKSIGPFVSSMKPYIMPTISKDSISQSLNLISFTANKSDEIEAAKQSSTTEMNSDEQEESTNDSEIESKVRKSSSKWKIQLQTKHLISTETRDIITETTAGPLVVARAQFLVTSTEPVNSLINASASVDELDNSTETTINSLLDNDSINEEDKSSFELDTQNKNYLRRRYSKRRNRLKRIRYLNEGPQRHRKKYKGI